jgi:hypothetical protein
LPACQVLLTAHVLWIAFGRSHCSRGETAGMYTPYPELTFQGCSLYLCYPSFLSSLPSFSQIYTVANEQGDIGGESGTALIERAAARLTTRFSASEANVLGEQQLQNRCALHFAVFESTRDNPRVRKRKRPVTPCVPTRLD